MQREAELHAEEDRKAKERVETRNNADNLAYQCEKALKDAGDKFPADKRSDLQASIDKVRDALKGSDEDAIKSAHEELQAKFQAVGEELYKNAAPSGATADATAASGGGEADAKAKRGGKDDDVIDAEFEDLGKGGKS
jgi:molecular chaperone DnaK